MRTASTRTVLAIGLLVALTLAGVFSFYASDSPDGLTRVAGDLGFSDAGRAAETNGGLLAGYEVTGVDHARWSGGLAGVLGCLVVLGCSTLLLRLRKQSPHPVHTRGE